MPAEGIQDGVDAERLGFRRVWLSERYDIKAADVLLSGIAARTERSGSPPARSIPARPVWLRRRFGGDYACVRTARGSRSLSRAGRR